MTEFVIPCETVARMSHILANVPEHREPHFNTILIENGVAMVTDGVVMAVELIGGNAGSAHVMFDDALKAQCKTEAPFGGKVVITVNEMLQFATAKTTFGYVHPANVVLFSPNVSPARRWREIVDKVRYPAPVAKGGMCWKTDVIARIGMASPSGKIVFEERIDLERPVLVRDLDDPNWFGMFQPFVEENISFEPALLPGWFE